MNTPNYSLIYISGVGRSGSTLLSNCLRKIEGSINIGEFLYLVFDYEARARNLECSCGEIFNKCEFWEDYFGKINLNITASIWDKLRLRSILFKEPSFTDKEILEINNVEKTIIKMLSDNNRKVVIDSSKSAGILYILSYFQNIKVTNIQFIRDLEGVVQSWSKSKQHLRKKRTLKTILDWHLINRLIVKISNKKRISTFCVAYNKFVEDQESTYGLLEKEGFNFSETLDKNFHVIAGNPDGRNFENTVNVKVLNKRYESVSFLCRLYRLIFGYRIDGFK